VILILLALGGMSAHARIGIAPGLNTITFDNRSGKDALIKLVGPSGQTVTVPNGEFKTVNVAEGQYSILLRFGSSPTEYSYLQGDPFTLSASASEHSAMKIALHALNRGNYATRAITASLFDAVAAGSAAPAQPATSTFGTMAANKFTLATGKELSAALPPEFNIEGNSIPAERRNAALLETAAGKHLVLALIDTAGYSSEVKKKYVGVMIAESEVAVCGHPILGGNYAFGLDKSAVATSSHATFLLYDQGGNKVVECAAGEDPQFAKPRPLQVQMSDDGFARLYLGRYWVDLR
jgi:hypothetical protein